MLTDRGYDVKNMSLTKEKFIEWAGKDDIRTNKEALAFTAKKEGENTYVAWSDDPKLGTKITNILIEMEKEDAKRAIIAVDLSVTPNTNGIITSLKVNGVFINYFTITELQFNVTKHVLVPKHVLCSEKEKLQVFKSYGIKSKDSLPHISANEAICKYYGALKGQLFKIIRDSNTQPGQKAISYRYVV